MRAVDLVVHVVLEEFEILGVSEDEEDSLKAVDELCEDLLLVEALHSKSTNSDVIIFTNLSEGFRDYEISQEKE